MRERLAAAGVRQPAFRPLPLDGDPLALAQEVDYPCVLKPLALSASRGVIRADDAAPVRRCHRFAFGPSWAATTSR